MNFAKKSTFPNFLGGILLVCYKGYLLRYIKHTFTILKCRSFRESYFPVPYHRRERGGSGRGEGEKERYVEVRGSGRARELSIYSCMYN